MGDVKKVNKGKVEDCGEVSDYGMASPARWSRRESLKEQESFIKVFLKVCGDEGSTDISVTNLMGKLKDAGFSPFDDIRFKPLINIIKKKMWASETIKFNICLDRKTINASMLNGLPSKCTELVKKALFGTTAIPEFSSFSSELQEIYNKAAKYTKGEMDDFISPDISFEDYWGVSICSVDGQVWSHGDSTIPVTLHSCSAVLNYAIAISLYGSDFVHKYVGKEATPHGLTNQIDLDKNNLPHNALIQSGAISMTSLMLYEQPDLPSCFDNVINSYQKMAGNTPLKINNTMYLADKAQNDRKFSIAYLLKEYNVFPSKCNIQNIIDLYFQLNAVEITCETGAVIAGTLANGGICPTTGEKVLSVTAVQNTLSMLQLQGMSEYSGEWMFEVGIPAKSSRSGMILVVVPGIMGVCVYSPPLDMYGNSIRGIEFTKTMSKHYALHFLEHHMSTPRSKENLLWRNGGRESHEQIVMNIMNAAAHGDLNLLSRYDDLGIDLNVADYDGRTALHLACCNDNIRIAKFLIKHNVELCALDRWNRSPLDDAVKYASPELVKLLKKHKAFEGPGLIEIGE